MDKWQMYGETKNLFEAGENVSTAQRDKVTPDQKRLLIEAVYDLQSGSYTSAYAANSQSEYHLYMQAIGRAHVCTPVTNAQLVCLLRLDNNNTTTHYQPRTT